MHQVVVTSRCSLLLHKLTNSFHSDCSYVSMTYLTFFSWSSLADTRTQSRDRECSTKLVCPVCIGCWMWEGGDIHVYWHLLAGLVHPHGQFLQRRRSQRPTGWILSLGKFSYAACAPLFYTCGLPSVLSIFSFDIPVFFDTDISHELCVIRTRTLLCIQRQDHPSCHKPLRPTPPI